MPKNYPKKPQHKRLDALLIFVFIFLAAIILRLFDLQVLKNPYYEALASGQQEIFETIVADRGEIYVEDQYSKELYPLALNKKMNLVFAVPKQIEDKGEAAEKLSPLLQMKKEEIEKKLNEASGPLYAPLKHKVSDETAEKIKNLNMEGLHFQKEATRFYPDKTLAAHTLGFLGYKDDKKKGMYGVEGYYDYLLSGKEGKIKSETDASRKFVLIGSKFFEKAEDGADIVLTLDRLVQFKAEKAIEEGTKMYGADRGSIVIMDPKTGEIIALAVWPNFDPNEYYKVDNIDVFRNSIVYDLYEPGSVAKPLVMAAALDLGLVSPSTTVVDNGEIKVDKFKIRNFDGKANGKVTMTRVLENSINVGMVQVASMIGKERLLDYFDRFGFTKLSGIDLDTEMPTEFKESKEWADSDLATASFGQGFSVTALKILSVFSAIANSGKMMQPHIVKKIIYPDGKEEIIYPKEVALAISPQTASTLSAMLTSVVENGQAQLAKVPGYKVAGKGGTAQVPNPDKVGYDPSKRITSFAGFGPIDDPKFVMLIKFDNPKGEAWGVTTAGPIFSQMAKDLFHYYQVPPRE